MPLSVLTIGTVNHAAGVRVTLDSFREHHPGSRLFTCLVDGRPEHRRALGLPGEVFSIEDMEQVSQVGQIDAHQLPYNLLWRFNERDIIPYCVAHNIPVITYSSIAHGILTGRYVRDLILPPGDQRSSVVLFDPDVWPTIYAGVETFKKVAENANRSLIHLAIRWVIHQKNVTSVLVGARNAKQVISNVEALNGEIPEQVFNELTAISIRLMEQIPDEGNPYGHHP